MTRVYAAASIGLLSLHLSFQAKDRMEPIPHHVSPIEIAFEQVAADPQTTANAQESLGFLLGFAAAYGAMALFIRRHCLALRS